MRISFYLHAPMLPDAGAPGAMLALAGALEARGHACTLTTFADMPRMVGKAQTPLFGPFTAWHARYHGRGAAPDVIDASTGDAWLLGYLPRPARPLLVTHSHGLEHVVHDAYLADLAQQGRRPSWRYPLYNGGWRLWEVRRSLRAADLCLLLNQHDRDVAVDRLGIDPSRCRIVANGCADVLLDHRTPPAAAPPGTGLRIAWVGSFIHRKGADYAATALSHFLTAHPHTTVSLLGTGLAEDAVLAAFAPAVRPRLTIVPRFARIDLLRLLHDRDVLLFPSLAEGFPLSLVEAMSCGLAPIVTDIPGPTEIVTDNREGLVIPPSDAAAIEVALERLAADPALLMRLRWAAWHKAAQYRWSTIATGREALYEEFLDRRAEEIRYAGQRRRTTR